jgi:hypothetical protein
MNKLLKLTAAAGVALTLSTSASAAMVTQWSYSLNSVWSAATGSGPAAVTGVGTQTLSWGTSTGSGQSQLVVTDPAAGTIDTNAGPAAGVTVTHRNRPITNFAGAFTGTTLSATLALAPLAPVPAAGFPFVQNIDIKFVETLNQSGTCSITTGAPCPDLFVLVDPSQAGGAQNFIYNGFQYTLTVFPLSSGSFTNLPASACAEAGMAAGCIGFSTNENAINDVPFGFTIKGREVVSEPGILALAGLGLAGLGFAARRRKAA